MDKADKAKELFMQGYTCTQAVLGAFCQDYGMDFDMAMRLASPVGGGVGRMREVCGAVIGMCMAAGLKYGNDDPEDRTAKAESYAVAQRMILRFMEENGGTMICRDLLGIGKEAPSPVPQERTAEYMATRPCPRLVYCAAKILEEYMAQEG